MSLVNTPANQKICPFMSGRPIAVAVPQVIEHQNAQAVSTMMVACAKEKCALWCVDSCCSLELGGMAQVFGKIAVGLVDVAAGLKPFDAPLSGSPTTHLVEAIESLIVILRDRKTSPITPK